MRHVTGIDLDVFRRYAGLSLPRHVAYPMPTWWHEVDAAEAARLRALSLNPPVRDLSIYLHLPFCEKMCRFCACNRVIMRKDGASSAGRLERYLDALIQELRLRSSDVGLDRQRTVRQLHWGGGTPTYLSCADIERLHGTTAELFSIAADAEVSIEVDPRVTTKEQLETLHSLGFNRVSLGVQDYDPAVQKHIGRVQPFEMVRQTVEDARAAGFESVNFDLIYGLPRQTMANIENMLTKTIELSPDRIAFYHYAQIPDRIANQRKLDQSAMPDSETKLAMFLLARDRFLETDYEFIGLDHFAKSTEMLAKALESGNITRTFQGMTTGAELDLFGFGASAISGLPRRMYLQNVRDEKDYVACMLDGGDPGIKGMAFSEDDAIRQAALMQLYCHGEVDPARLREEVNVYFHEYFAAEQGQLDQLAQDGLLERTENGGVRLTDPLGRVLMRNVGAVFDGYLPAEAPWQGMQQTYSANA